jgi:hypothetical protein
MSRTRCGILDAAPQSRDPALAKIAGPRLSSAPLRKSYALRCVRGTKHHGFPDCLPKSRLST